MIQLRSQLGNAEARERLRISDSDWHALLRGDSGVLEKVLLFVAQIQYDGPTGTVVIVLRDPTGGAGAHGESTFQYRIPRRRGRALPAFRLRPASETLTRPPRLARLVALAHKLEALVRLAKVKDFAELARLARVSSARIGQIVILGQLSPAIQEHILFLADEHEMRLGERQLREIARLPRWDHQQALFQQILGEAGDETLK